MRLARRIALVLLQVGALAPLGAKAQTSLDLIVKETENVERLGEMVHNGIPIGRAMSLKNVANLKITDNTTGKQVPAQFEVLSRWGGPLQSDSSIQWLMVTFPADLKALEKKTFTLSSGLNIAPAKPISIASSSTNIIVSTGVAKFTLDKSNFSILQAGSLIADDGMETQVIGSAVRGSSSSINVQGVGDMNASPPEEVAIEHQGSLTVTVKMRGHYSSTVLGGKALAYVARLTFNAGSPTVEVDYHFYWPGSTAGGIGESLGQIGIITEEQTAKSILVNSAKIRIPLNFSGPLTGFVKSESGRGITGPVTGDGSVSLMQYRLESQYAKPKYISRIGGIADSGKFAETPFIMVNGSNGGVGASIQKMKYYEPQSLSLGPQTLEIALVAQPQYMSPFTGGYAKAYITLKAPLVDPSQFQSRIAAEVDHRLFAWPAIADVSKSMVLGEIWDGTPNFTASSYLKRMETISQNTLNTFTDSGMVGFMTYGLPSRYMTYGPEGGGNKTWDGFFWNGAFTDYHNTMSNSVYLFAMTGNAEWLYNLAFPAARRTLKTQIVQSDAKDSGYFDGWAPAGYGGYRKDPNSCHSYFENLYLYYYLTGDREAVDNLQKAGNTLRKSYGRDKLGNLIPPELPNAAPWIVAEGRISSQQIGIFWFLGHATSDYSFIADYRNQCERLVSRCMALLKKDTVEYGFISQNEIPDSADSTLGEQNWMLGMYPMNDFWKLYMEYGDLPLGKNAVKISRIFKDIERTQWEYTAKVFEGGDGTANGLWANSLMPKWIGSKMGGTIKTVTYVPAQEPHLWQTGKALLSSLSFRTGALNPGNPVYGQHGLDLYNNVFDNLKMEPTTAWDKEQGEYFTRIHPALKYISQGGMGSNKIQQWRKKSNGPIMPKVRSLSGMLQMKDLMPGAEVLITTLSGKEIWHMEFNKGIDSYTLNLNDVAFAHSAVLVYQLSDQRQRLVESGRFVLSRLN